MLTTDLDGEDEKDKGALDNLLSQLIAELGMDKKVKVGRCAVRRAGISQEPFSVSSFLRGAASGF